MINCFADPFKADSPFSTTKLCFHNLSISFFNFSTAGVDFFQISTSSTLSNQFAQSTTVSTFCLMADGICLDGKSFFSGIKIGAEIFLFFPIQRVFFSAAFSASSSSPKIFKQKIHKIIFF